MIEDIAYKYIDLRGSNGLCFAKPHVQEKHIHIHFLFSGSESKSSKTLRMDNQTFRRVRTEIERYQLERYPELKHSVVYLKDRAKEREVGRSGSKEREFQLKKRTKKMTEKEKLLALVKASLASANGIKEFYDLLTSGGCEVYERKGKVEGVKWGRRKYRFRTLGVDEQTLESISKQTAINNLDDSILSKYSRNRKIYGKEKPPKRRNHNRGGFDRDVEF